MSPRQNPEYVSRMSGHNAAGCRRHVRTGQLGAFIIMFTENLEQSSCTGGMFTPKTVQDTAGEKPLHLRFPVHAVFSYYPQTDRIKIQIQFFVLTLLFQSLSFCHRLHNSGRIVFFTEASTRTPFTVILIIIGASPFDSISSYECRQ